MGAIDSNWDVVVVGAGPAGCSTALNLLASGVTPLLLEMDAFPRFHIGESLTGGAAVILDGLGLTDSMRSADFPTKLGVKVFAPGGDEAKSFFVPVPVASTYQVDRAEFDDLLLNTVRARGGAVHRLRAVDVLREGNTVRGLVVQRNDRYETVRARVVVDASGSRCFLSHKGVAGRRERGKYDKQVAVFSRFRIPRSLQPWDGEASHHPGNTLLFIRRKHHWAWWIPLSETTISVGVVANSSEFVASNEPPRAFLEREIRELHPELCARLAGANLIDEVRTAANYSYSIANFAGPGYLCVGDAHRFIDPIFSFGVHIALSEGGFAAAAIADHLSGSSRDDRFESYRELSERGQGAFSNLIDFFWEYPLHFLRYLRHLHRDELISIFAGRVYDDTPNTALRDLTRLLMSGLPSYRMPGENRLERLARGH
jgi:1H-pyrrole-2-carbonyl-[peptidyl-carrier protein] brominase